MWLLGFVFLTLNVFSQCSDELLLEAVFQGLKFTNHEKHFFNCF